MYNGNAQNLQKNSDSFFSFLVLLRRYLVSCACYKFARELIKACCFPMEDNVVRQQPSWSAESLFSRTEEFPKNESEKRFVATNNESTALTKTTTPIENNTDEINFNEDEDMMMEENNNYDNNDLDFPGKPLLDPRELPINLNDEDQDADDNKSDDQVKAKEEEKNEKELSPTTKEEKEQVNQVPPTTRPESELESQPKSQLESQLESQLQSQLQSQPKSQNEKGETIPNTTATTTSNKIVEPPFVNRSTLSISGVDRQLHDTATEQLQRLRVSELEDGRNSPSFISSASSPSSATSSVTATTTTSPHLYSDTHAVVREFFNHYSRSFDVDVSGIDIVRSQLETSSAQRRMSRVGFQDFARDIGVLGNVEGDINNINDYNETTTILQRDHVDEVFVRTLEQQRRELNSYSNNAAQSSTLSFEHSERLNTGLDYKSFHEATTELFAVLSHDEEKKQRNVEGNDSVDHHDAMGEDVVRRLNETLGMHRARLVEDAAMLGVHGVHGVHQQEQQHQQHQQQKYQRGEDVTNNTTYNDMKSAPSTPSSTVLMTPSSSVRGNDTLQDRSLSSDISNTPNKTVLSRPPSMVEIAKVKRKLRAAGMCFLKQYFDFFK